MFKKYINNGLRALGYEIQRTGREKSLTTVLAHAKKMGFTPATVIDGGAAHGNWSKECSAVFPDAEYLLIEPLQEYQQDLQDTVAAIGHAAIVPLVLKNDSGTVSFNVHPDLEGSSLFMEEGGAAVNGFTRTLPAGTLDAVVAEKRAGGPYLLKLDVQGAELEVLRGGEETLKKTEYVILETSLFAAYDNVPLLHDVIAFMAARGFVSYDILGLLYRPLDGALCQADVCFVKENGMFRKERAYRRHVVLTPPDSCSPFENSPLAETQAAFFIPPSFLWYSN